MDFLEVCTILVCCKEVCFSCEQRKGEILTTPTIHVAGREITSYLVGNSAYPLSTWLMKPYPEGTSDPDEVGFNKGLLPAIVQVKCTFGS